MTMTDTGLTIRERFEAAAEAAMKAEENFSAKGAAATPEDEQACKDANAALVAAGELYASSKAGKAVLANLAAGRDVDHDELEAMASATGIPNPNANPGMTLGEAFVSSDAYAELRDNHLRHGGDSRNQIGRSRAVDFGVSLNEFMGGGRFRFADGDGPKNALVTGAGDSSGGALVDPLRLPGITDPAPLRRTSVLELFTRIPLTSDSMEFVQVASKTNNAATVPEATTSSNAARGDGTGGTITAAAAGDKPESAMTVEKVTVLVETLAHWMAVTRRAAADAPQLVALLNQFLFAGLNVKAEDNVLNGNGTSPNLRGLLNTSDAWNINVFDVSNNGSPSRLDAVALAAGTIYNAGEGEWEPTAVLINPLDWFSTNFVLAKDDNGQYHGPGPWAAMGMNAPWGIRPVLTKAVAQGVQVVGDFRQGFLGDRQQNTLYITDSHADWFTRNILAFLAEMRLAFGVRVPTAFTQIVA